MPTKPVCVCVSVRVREREGRGEGREIEKTRGNQGKSLYLILLYRILRPNYRRKNEKTLSFAAMTQVSESAWLDSQHVRSPAWMIFCSSNVELELAPIAGYNVNVHDSLACIPLSHLVCATLFIATINAHISHPRYSSKKSSSTHPL